MSDLEKLKEAALKKFNQGNLEMSFTACHCIDKLADEETFGKYQIGIMGKYLMVCGVNAKEAKEVNDPIIESWKKSIEEKQSAEFVWNNLREVKRDRLDAAFKANRKQPITHLKI